MTEPLFHVIAEGRAAVGLDTAAVAQRLEQQLKLTAPQAARLLAGSPVVAKRGVTQAIAEQYCARLGALGLQVRIEPAAPSPAIDTPSSSSDEARLATLFGDAATSLPGLRSMRYRLAVAAIGAQLSLSVFVYACIVLLGVAALIGYSVAYHSLLTAPPLPFSITVFLLPWLALLTLNALLLRPLLPRRHTIAADTTVTAQQQPLLLRWLSLLCARSGLPMPHAVTIGAQPTHSVDLASGRGAWRRADYRLRLSLPLLETSSLRDNTALVVALLVAQGRSVDIRWRHLLRVVDARIEYCRELHDVIGVQCARHRLLRVLPILHNRLLTVFASRIETLQRRLQRSALLEEDRLYALLAGSAEFTDHLLRRHKLELAVRDADALNRSDRVDAGLAADLPALIRHYHDHADANAEQQLRRQWRDVVRRSARDECPTPAERIEAAESLAAAGLLGADIDIALLAQRDALAQQVTTTTYLQAGMAFEPERLLSVDALTFAATEDLLQREQTVQYFNKWFRPFRFWRMTDYALVRAMPIADAVQQLNVCVAEIRRLSPDRTRLLHEHERLYGQLQELLVGQHLQAQGQPHGVRHIARDGAALQPLIDERHEQLAKIAEQLGTQETIMGGRISLALRLCGESEQSAARIHRALQLLGGLESRLYKLALDVHQLEQLAQRHYLRRETHYAVPIRKLEEKIDDACVLLRERLKDIPYPLDTRHATLGDFIAAQADDAPARGESKSATLDRAGQLLRRLHAFNEELSRTAANFGTVAEEAYSIEPIRLLASS